MLTLDGQPRKKVNVPSYRFSDEEMTTEGSLSVELKGRPCRAVAAAPAFAQMGFSAAAFNRFANEGWWARQDSNLQPDRYERPALTIELQAPPRGGRGWAAGNGARFVYRA